jgi:NADPH:quinone reductase-like Zn-dependent oxidoreductase
VVIIGVGGGGRVEVDLLSVMTKRLHITGSTLRARSRSEKASVAAAVRRDLVPAWDRGELQIPLAGIYPMVDAIAAYDAFSVKGKVGKIVLAMSATHAD